MKLSILTVITDRDKAYNDLLVKSIQKTISLDESDYEIIIHDNNDVIQQLSYAHAIGLTEGYKKTKGEIVLILDFCSAIRCEDYEMPFFYRSHFLAIKSSFYKNLIINHRGFFPETSNGKIINDMSYKITKYCIDSNMKYVHYKNSNDDGLFKFYGNSGETIYNHEGNPFFHHIGRGSQKPERLSSWIEFWSNHKQEK